MTELWKPQNVENTSQILLKMFFFLTDMHCTEGFVEVKISKNQRLLAEK